MPPYATEAPVAYMARTRAYYRALGYDGDYIWATFQAMTISGIGLSARMPASQASILANTRMARRMHEAISDSRLVILPELRHSVLMEAPDLIADHLLEFLK